MDLVKFGKIGYGNASMYHTLGVKKDPNPYLEFIAESKYIKRKNSF